MRRDVYSGTLRLHGEEHEKTVQAAFNYANTLFVLKRYKEAKALMCKAMPVARRVLGENYELTLKIRNIYARALYEDASTTLDGLRVAVTTLEDAERIARRVFGGEHPFTRELEDSLRQARAELGDVEPLRAAVEAMAPGDA